VEGERWEQEETKRRPLKSALIWVPEPEGTKEIDSAAITVEEVAEAVAVPVIDDVRGPSFEVYISLKPGYSPSPELEQKVAKAIETEIGKIARPKNVWIARSGDFTAEEDKEIAAYGESG